MNGPDTIKADRIILRRYKHSDEQDYDRILEHPAMIRHVDMIKRPLSGEHLIFLIEEKNSELLLGMCGFLKTNKENKLEIMFSLLDEFQGNGYMIEAMLKLFNWLFETTRTRKIIAHVNAGNTRGWKAVERAGMRYMGQRKQKSFENAPMHFKLERKDYSLQRSYY